MVSACAADFGLSKIIDADMHTQTVCGTPGYCCSFASLHFTSLTYNSRLSCCLSCVCSLVKMYYFSLILFLKIHMNFF